LPNPGNYTNCPTLETTQNAQTWKLHRLPNPGNYTDCPTLETTQTVQTPKLHRLPKPGNYTDCPILETTPAAQPWKLHRLPNPGNYTDCLNLGPAKINFYRKYHSEVQREKLEIITLNATFEVLAVVLLKIQAFWDEALYPWASGSCCF